MHETCPDPITDFAGKPYNFFEIMAIFDFDLFVIGAGSGGVRAARMSTSFGARVAIAEKQKLGGTCVNAGCVPKKLFYYASSYGEAFDDANGFGWETINPPFHWKQLLKNKDREISRLNEIYKKLLLDAGVVILSGHALITGPHTVILDNTSYTAERILIASGGQPVLPDIPGGQYCISSDHVFHLPQLPEKILIVGGGYIAVEFAGIFNGLGVDTTLVYRGPLPLQGFDTEAREFLIQEMQKKSVRLLLNTSISNIEPAARGYSVRYSDGKTDSADLIMYAIGRHPNTSGLGLERAGIQLDANGAIIINSHFQSNIPSVYAIGDVTNRIQLTPVAIAEAMVLARSLFGNQPSEVNYTNIPTCVFSQPNLATVGLTEEKARLEYKDIAIYKTTFRPMKHTMTGKNEKTLMKLVVDKATDNVLGAHMVASEAGEIIQGIAIAIKAGATKAQFDSTIGIHPTAAEEFFTMRQASENETPSTG